MTTVTIHQAKTNLSRLIAEVEAGGEIVIARNKEPVARLVPIHSKANRIPGQLKGKFSISEDFSAPLTDDESTGWGKGAV